ncbi:hypothetical protein AOQ84DRAFT_353117 [Glonium stellatum]|uniref:Uncharacterized protein n=1 Tax=Glonium stellatum TaxID=574774 RepID=A0A8E2JW22_9PEZI|nr:hypothetical protein AOQ84DRAFT_353117 [Glonium stellatum]
MYIPTDPDPSSEESPHHPHATYNPNDPSGHHSADPSPQHSRSKEAAGEKKKPLTKAQLKIRREQETRLARKKVHDVLEGWHVLFRGEKGKPYFQAGEVVREEGWLERLEPRELCESARKSRPVRKD